MLRKTIDVTAVAASAFVLNACTTWQTAEPVRPTTYKTSDAIIQRTVGQLRRVLLITVEMPVPSKCDTANAEWQIIGDTRGVGVLLTNRGYEVVLGTEDRLRGLLEPDPREPVGTLLAELRAFRRDGSVSPAAGAWARKLGNAAAADAVMLVESDFYCSPVLNEGLNFDRVLMGLYTFGLSELIMLAVPPKSTPDVFARLRAVIFETSSGRPAWYSCPRCDMIHRSTKDRFKSDTAEELIGDFETAVPKLLTR